MFLAALGGLFFGSGLLRLPRWAATRELQMEGIAERLTVSMAAGPALGDGGTAGA